MKGRNTFLCQFHAIAVKLLKMAAAEVQLTSTKALHDVDDCKKIDWTI